MQNRMRLIALDTAAGVVSLAAAAAVFARHTPPLVALAAVLMLTVAVAVARWWPLVALALVLPVFWAVPTAAQLPYLGLLPMLYVLFRVGSLLPWRFSLPGLAAALTGAIATALPDFAHRGGILPFAVVFTAAWALGCAYRQRQTRAAAELTRARADLAEQRLLIARELHDIVAHSLSVITVQAGYGHLAFDTDPAQSRAALAAIETTGREALVELRLMLGVLRDAPDATTAPMPGLADLAALAEGTRQAGVRVELTVGDVPPVSAAVGLSAYRIVQESFTNAVRHARARSVRAVIGYTINDLVVEVTDDGRGGPAGATGHGLAGMAERASLHGGSLAAGPRPGGGWQVRATLPLPAEAAA